MRRLWRQAGGVHRAAGGLLLSVPAGRAIHRAAVPTVRLDAGLLLGRAVHPLPQVRTRPHERQAVSGMLLLGHPRRMDQSVSGLPGLAAQAARCRPVRPLRPSRQPRQGHDLPSLSQAACPRRRWRGSRLGHLPSAVLQHRVPLLEARAARRSHGTSHPYCRGSGIAAALPAARVPGPHRPAQPASPAEDLPLVRSAAGQGRAQQDLPCLHARRPGHATTMPQVRVGRGLLLGRSVYPVPQVRAEDRRLLPGLLCVGHLARGQLAVPRLLQLAAQPPGRR